MDTLCQNNPFLIVLIGDLNTKSKSWYYHEKSSHEGTAIEYVTAQFGLQQIVKTPAHISNTSSSCIDLIFTSQSNLVTDSGAHSSLHPNSHHQLVFSKLKLHIVYPPLYLREIWHYREANTGLIRRVIKEFNWERVFLNTSFNKKVDIFNRTILNILSNFIPHEIIGARKSAPGKSAPGKLTPGNKPPRKIAPRKITPQKIAPRKIAPPPLPLKKVFCKASSCYGIS